MAKIQAKQLNVEMQLRAIELLQSALHLPPPASKNVSSFNFNIHIEIRIEPVQKRVYDVVHVEIHNEDQTIPLGSLSVSCIFEIANFEQLLLKGADGVYTLPQELAVTLNSISISTTRGVMFSAFKGTFLHGAVLPIVDPKQFKVEANQ
ncbi:MAG: hypothetical protein C0424_05995 [Sphingobacteriaceae bacterium]|nr:hypothetical protein [Sphingobacteriaceae bacterium]